MPPKLSKLVEVNLTGNYTNKIKATRYYTPFESEGVYHMITEFQIKCPAPRYKYYRRPS